MEKIHGTSAHLSWKDRKLAFHSGGAAHANFVKIFDGETLYSKLAEKMGDEAVTIFGEAYGGKEQGMSNTYGKELKFVAFDVQIGGVWLSVPQAEDFVKSLGLEFVHYVKVPTDLEALNKERDADSVQAVRNGVGEGKMREGVVLRPLIELCKNDGGRIICKHKRDEFRETQTTRAVVDPAKMRVLEDAAAVASEWVTARRLEHVLDKIPQPWDIKQTPLVISAMIEDVTREGRGEFEETPEVKKAIGRKSAEMFKKFFQKKLQEAAKEE